jgi:hypothetical protein
MKKKAEETALATVDRTTGEISERPIELTTQSLNPNYLTTPRGDYGALAVSERAAEILSMPLTDDEVDILPTGEVYLSQIGYRRRLMAAFGPGAWTLVRVGPSIQQGNTLVQEWELHVLGRFVSVAYGEADYHESNPRTTWATAFESAKSNALMRLCKDLGVASECWDRRWTEQFKARCCTRVWRRGEKKPQWRRLDAPPFFDETGEAKPTGPAAVETFDVEPPPVEGSGSARSRSAAPAPSAPAANGQPSGPPRRGTGTITTGQQKRLFAILMGRAEDLQISPDVVKAALKTEMDKLGFAGSADITMAAYDGLVEFVRAFTPEGGVEPPPAPEEDADLF